MGVRSRAARLVYWAVVLQSMKILMNQFIHQFPFVASTRTSHTRRTRLEEVSVDFGRLMDFHLLLQVSLYQLRKQQHSYHLERVELLLDRLRQHRRQPVAGCNFSPSVIFTAWPCIMKYNPWTERNITSQMSLTFWRAWQALRVRGGEACY